jgi:hypothetical protein
VPVTVLTVDVTVTEPPEAMLESWLDVKVTIWTWLNDEEDV